jgi:hypothetical protein
MARIVEVDEQHLGSLKNTADIVQGMLRNPKTRRKMLEAYKEHVPTAAIPELDAMSPIEQRIGGIEQAVVEFITESRKERESEKTNSRLEQIKAEVESGRKMLKQRGYTDDGIKQLEDFRDQKGLVDYSDAIRLFEFDHPPPKVSEPDGRMSLFDMQNKDTSDQFHKRLWDSQGEDSSAVNQMAFDAIAELRGAAPRR